ncbi:MAG: tripartite tricarboxylate transporter substrate binding protein [Burkholderiales bacterium]
MGGAVRSSTTRRGNVAGRMLLAFFCALAAAVPASAQQYPARPVRMIVATVPGGGTDAIARIMATKLSALLGQQFVVDNRAGGGGIIGTETVARANADGHTLLMAFIAGMAMNPALTRTPYDPLKDFTPVSLIAGAQYVLTIHPSVPARTLKDLVAYAKANPGKLNYASAGNGTPVHLAAELFKSVAAINLTHIPYKGGGPAGAAVLSGESQVIFGSVTATMPQIKAGKLVALGVTGPARLANAPELPTISEQGYPGFEVTSWYGIVGPARLPQNVVGRLNGAIVTALRASEVREQLARQGMDPIGSNPEEFAAHLKREVMKWARVIKDAGIKAD